MIHHDVPQAIKRVAQQASMIDHDFLGRKRFWNMIFGLTTWDSYQNPVATGILWEWNGLKEGQPVKDVKTKTVISINCDSVESWWRSLGKSNRWSIVLDFLARTVRVLEGIIQNDTMSKKM